MARALLFGHLMGVALLVFMLSIEVIALLGLARGRVVAELRAATHAAGFIPRVAPLATVVLVGTGLGMVAMSDRWAFGDAWIVLSLALTVVLSITGPTVHGRRIERAAEHVRREPDGPAPAAVASLAADRAMRFSGWIGVSQFVVLLFLMTVKPGLGVGLVGIVVGALLGMVAAVTVGRRRAPAPAAA